MNRCEFRNFRAELLNLLCLLLHLLLCRVRELRLLLLLGLVLLELRIGRALLQLDAWLLEGRHLCGLRWARLWGSPCRLIELGGREWGGSPLLLLSHELSSELLLLLCCHCLLLLRCLLHRRSLLCHWLGTGDRGAVTPLPRPARGSGWVHEITGHANTAPIATLCQSRAILVE